MLWLASESDWYQLTGVLMGTAFGAGNCTHMVCDALSTGNCVQTGKGCIYPVLGICAAVLFVALRCLLTACVALLLFLPAADQGQYLCRYSLLLLRLLLGGLLCVQVHQCNHWWCLQGLIQL